ncbi:Odorant receptor 46a, isoform A [Trachymyrmex cornetzi]|uniref:Odorant receptor 46a, isoform A n=2 Tax=Trachymyrmex cornetzi TaxID=471704 RepID=A0A195EL37_9HYME|nr:Odorant receptor 46a, isoform A [Trachymyrmex cornetzi]
MQILSLNFFIYNLCGMWRPNEWSSNGAKLLYNVFTFMVIFSEYFLVVTQFMDIIFIVDNIDDFATNTLMFLTIVAVCCKATIVVIRRNAINNLVQLLMETPCKPRDEDELAIETKFDTFIRSCSIKYSLLATSSVTGTTIGSVLNIMQGHLPYRIWLPYNYNVSTMFWATSVHQIITVIFSAMINIGTDTLLFGLILHTCTQLKIFESRLHKLIINRTIRYLENTFPSSNKNKTGISECIRHHLSIYKYAETVNVIFNQVLFVQFFASILVLCTSVYYMSIHISDFYGSLPFLVYTIGMFVQIYVYCWSGNEVILKSMSVGDAIYCTDWPLLSVNEKKELLMVMIRSTIPIKNFKEGISNMQMFSLNFFMYTICGMWRPIEWTSKVVNFLYNVFNYIVLLLEYFTMLTQFLDFLFVIDNVDDFVANSIWFVSFVDMVCKATVVVIRRNAIISLIQVLLKGPCKPQDEDEIAIQTKFDKFVRLCSMKYLFLGIISLIGVTIGSVFKIMHGQLPCRIWLPFDYNVSLVFWIVSIQQIIAIIFGTFIAVATDTLVSGLILETCVQLEIFENRLHKLINNKTVKYLGNALCSLNEDKTRISKCIRHHLSIYKLCSMKYLLLAMSSLTGVIIGSVLNIMQGQLPCRIWLPFDYNVSLVFWIISIQQVIAMIAGTIINIGTETLVFGLILETCAQFEIFENRLHKLINNKTVKYLENTFCSLNEDKTGISKCIRHHLSIYKYAKTVNAIFNQVLFVQFFGSILILCTCIYYLSMHFTELSGIGTLIVYIISMFVQIYIYCWSGNQVMLKVTYSIIAFIRYIPDPNMQMLSLNFFIYTVSGIWRPVEWSSNGAKLLYNVFTFMVIFSEYFLVLTQFMDIVLIVDNIDDFATNTLMFLSIVAVCCKATVVVVRRNAIINLVEILLKAPYKPRDEDEVAIQTKFDKFIRSCSIKYSLLATSSVTSTTIGSVLNAMQGHLPYRIWLPCDYNVTTTFWIISVHQILAIIFATMINVGTETLVFGLILQTCAQLEIFKSRLHKFIIKKTVTYLGHARSLSNEDKTWISECIRHHLSIYKYAKTVNSIFNQVLFVQFFSSILVLCTCVYYLSIHIQELSAAASLLAYTICMFVQIFVYCWSGNEVMLKSMSIADAIYRMNWPLLSINEKKGLLMIMIRSTIPVKFTSSFLITLSLQSYSNVIIFVVNNVDDFATNTLVFLSTIVVCCKTTVIVVRRNAIINLVQVLLKVPYKPRDEDEKAIQTKFDKFIRSCSIKYTLLATSSITGGTIGSVLKAMQGHLPYRIWLPCNYNISTIFWIISIHQMVTTIFATLINVGTETLVFGLILQTCAQFEILESRLHKLIINNTVTYLGHTSCLLNKNKASLSECIRHHLSIYKYAKTVNVIFNQVLFVQFFVSILVICTSVYYLSIHITELSNAIYRMNWPLLSINEKKGLLMIMIRSTIPVKFTSSFLITLSLQSFSNVITFNITYLNEIKNNILHQCQYLLILLLLAKIIRRYSKKATSSVTGVTIGSVLNVMQGHLPYRIWLPYNYISTKFWIISIHQIVTLIFATLINVGTETLVFGLILQTCAQLEIFKSRLHKFIIKKTVKYLGRESSLLNEDETELSECIHHHLSIYK